MLYLCLLRPVALGDSHRANFDAERVAAEFGHEATQINVLTKSGGNQYHGALFEFLRNDILDAKPYSFTSKPQAKSPFKWNDFGFVLDGPVQIPKLFNGRDKLFFFFDYDQIVDHGNNTRTNSIPTTDVMAGNCSQTFGPLAAAAGVCGAGLPSRPTVPANNAAP